MYLPSENSVSVPLSNNNSSRTSNFSLTRTENQNDPEIEWLNQQFLPTPKIQTIQVDSEDSLQIIEKQRQHYLLYPKKAKRVDAETRSKAIHLFRLDNGTVSNEFIAHQIGFSTQKVYQMRKEFEKTNSIRLTIKNRHTPYYLNRFNLQNRILKQFVKNNRYAGLNDVQQDVREGGYWMSTTNIQKRLGDMGIFYTDVPDTYQNIYSNCPQIVQARYKYATWVQHRINQNLFFSAYEPFTIIDDLYIGWHRKNQIDALKAQVKQFDTFHICVTVGVQGLVGWTVKRKGDVKGIFVKHLKDNFDMIHNRHDYLVVNTPEDPTLQRDLFNFIKTSSIPYNKVINIPLESPFLSPAHMIIREIKKAVISRIDKRPMTRFAHEGEKEMEEIGEYIEYMLQNSYGKEKVEQIFVEMRRLIYKCLDRDCF